MSYLHKKCKNKWGNGLHFEDIISFVHACFRAVVAKNIMNESLETNLHCQGVFEWIY